MAIEEQYPRMRPSYCGGCGKPFPWTETALAAAKECADELEDLSPEEKLALKGTFEDLTSDTPRTQIAASRFNGFMKKVGPVAAGTLKQIVVSIATETAKKWMGL